MTTPHSTLRFALLLPISLVTSFLLCSCGQPVVPEPEVTLETLSGLSYGPPVEQFDERAAVKAVISAARFDDDWVVVRGSFTPIDPGYHLYSKDLPMEGIEETGRPTYLEITEGAVQNGSLLADKVPHEFTQYGVTLPVYPEGPVTLYRLVQPKSGKAALTAALTYMSCSTELCNLPVEREPISVSLP